MKRLCSIEYSNYMLKALREMEGLDEDDNSKDESFNTYSKGELFEKLLQYEGIPVYTVEKIIRQVYGEDFLK